MEILNGLFSPKRGPQVRFRAVTESYDLIDTMAERVDTQLIVHSDGVAIRDREPVGLYKLKGHDSLLVWDGPIVVETGLFRRPEVRSRWVLQEAYHIWLGYAEGTLTQAKAKFDFDAKSLRGLALFLGGAVFAVCIIAAIIISAVGGGAETAPAPTQSQGGNSHGFVEDPGPGDSGAESPSGEPAEAPARAPGDAGEQEAGSGDGEGAPEPVAPGDGPGG